MSSTTKPKPYLNPFEQALETVVKDPAKQTAAAVGQIINPINIIGEIMGIDKKSDTPASGDEKMMLNKQNHTPLDTANLNKNYEMQDKQKVEAVRNKLFQLVKSGEEKAIAEIQKQEADRKKQFEEEEQRKKQEEQEQLQAAGSGAEVAGKQKGRLGAARKKASTAPTMENKGKSSELLTRSLRQKE